MRTSKIMADRRLPIPHSTKRACLCRDGRYSKDCCGQDHYSQGIGNITGESLGDDWNGYIVTSCTDSHTRHVHIHNATLTVGSVYYLTLENGHDHCYTVTSTHHSEGVHINTASAEYNDCTACTDAN